MSDSKWEAGKVQTFKLRRSLRVDAAHDTESLLVDSGGARVGIQIYIFRCIIMMHHWHVMEVTVGLCMMPSVHLEYVSQFVFDSTL
jgi:hypothetical protein